MVTSKDRTIAITGCGWVTPLAVGSIADVLSAVAGGNSLAPNDTFHPISTEQLATAGDVSKEINRYHGAWVAAAALTHACRSARVELSAFQGDRVGLMLGCGFAGQLGMIDFANDVRQQTPRFVSPIHFPQTVGNYIAGALARGYDIRGPNATFASGIASSLDALLEAGRILSSRRADFVFAGGVEVLSDSIATGLAESTVALAEGACLCMLERLDDAEKRGAPVLATLDQDGLARQDHSGGGTASTKPSITSTAGFVETGAVCIERAIGRCLGAAAVSALAIAIGAAGGAVVPVGKSSGDVELTSLVPSSAPSSDGTLSAVVLLEEPGAGRRSIGLAARSG